MKRTPPLPPRSARNARRRFSSSRAVRSKLQVGLMNPREMAAFFEKA
ncbi:MAG: hypothetical protein ACLSHC_04490 [Bilophila wadsworthia]